MSLSCEGFTDLVSSNKGIVINNIYLMMMLLSEALVKVVLVFLKVHPDSTVTTFSSGVCCT